MIFPLVIGSWSPGSGLGLPGLPETSGMRGVTPEGGTEGGKRLDSGQIDKMASGKDQKATCTCDPRRLVDPAASWARLVCSSESCFLQEWRGPFRPLQMTRVPQSQAPVGHCPIAVNKAFALRALTAWLDGCCPWLLGGGWLGSWVRSANPLPLRAVHFGFIIHQEGPRQQPKPLPASA